MLVTTPDSVRRSERTPVPFKRRKMPEREAAKAHSAEEERRLREARRETRARQLRERHELEARQLRELHEEAVARRELEARQLRERHELEIDALDEDLAQQAREVQERLEARRSSRNKRSRDEGQPMLVRLLKDVPDVFEANVLPLLGIKDHIALTGVNRSCRGALTEVAAVRWLMSRGEEWDNVKLKREEFIREQWDKLKKKLPSDKRFRYICCATAAGDGHLKVLQWLRARDFKWDSQTCARAAGGGHLEVLQWARANGCAWDVDTCFRAAEGGHMEMLRWARVNGCPEYDNEGVV